MIEFFHKSYATTPEGTLIIADGINAVRRWDGLEATTDTAGVIPPSTALTLRQSGKGPIVGTYFAYTRFKDGRGNVSNLSPVSNDFRPYHAGSIVNATNTTPIAIGSVGHGLQDGDRVNVVNVQGNTAANGSWTVRFHDENNFSLNGSVGNGAHTPNTGHWVGGLTPPPARGIVATATNTSPIAIGSFAHGLTNGESVFIRDVLGNTAANGFWVITFIDANNFSLNGSVGNGVHTANTGHWTSSPVSPSSGTIILATNTSPITIGALRHGQSTGTSVLIEGVLGNTAANGTFTITAIDDNNFSLDGSVGNGGYSSGGTWKGGSGPPLHASTISAATNASPIVITSTNHGLTGGDWVRVTGVQGNTAANDLYEIERLGTDTFSLIDSVGNGAYTTGGTWTAGARMMLYTNVPVPTETKVTNRQILRNTDGQADTLFVDIDTTDLVDTSLESPLEDERLAEQEAVPILDTDGSTLANRFTVPPDHKATLAFHNGRMFYAAEVVVRQGHAQVTNGSATVTGIATNWKSTFAGRAFYVVNSTTKYTISSVNTVAQTLTLSAVYAGTTDLFAVYSIRPQPIEHRQIYYSESGLAESVPALNLITLPENEDEIVGQFSAGSYLFFLEKHHIWRYSVQNDPDIDGFAWPISTRGCVNNRCYTTIGETTYLLDTDGIYAFTGNGDVEPTSLPIQNLFRPSDSPYAINYEAAQNFHCSVYPNQETIRWFVCLSGQIHPRHAIVLNYRTQRWWIEEFNRPIDSSTVGELDGQRIVYLGSDAKTTLAMWRGYTDGPDPQTGTVYGTLTDASVLSLEMTGATFPSSGVVGNPITITDGRGKGQTRRVSSNTSTAIVLSQPWLVLPDSTSIIQVGGIPWSYQTGFFRYLESEDNLVTSVEATFKPQTLDATMDINIFHDYSTTPYEWTGSIRSDDNNGVRVDDGEPDLVADLTKDDGNVDHRIDRHRDPHIDGTRVISIGLAGVGGREPTMIYELAIDGAAR